MSVDHDLMVLLQSDVKLQLWSFTLIICIPYLLSLICCCFITSRYNRLNAKIENYTLSDIHQHQTNINTTITSKIAYTRDTEERFHKKAHKMHKNMTDEAQVHRKVPTTSGMFDNLNEALKSRVVSGNELK